MEYYEVFYWATPYKCESILVQAHNAAQAMKQAERELGPNISVTCAQTLEYSGE